MGKVEFIFIGLIITDVLLFAEALFFFVWVKKVGKRINSLQNRINIEVEKYIVHNNDMRGMEDAYEIDKTIYEEVEIPQIVIKTRTVYEPERIDNRPSIKGTIIGKDIKYPAGYLIFNKYSIRKLTEALEWGEYTKKNVVEQGGILLGTISLYGDEIYCFVEDILLAKTKGRPAFVEFTKDMWNDMQKELSTINEERDEKSKLVIIGWFHTHPNDLGVFMSGTDMETQRLNFPLEWQASLVMNPHKDLLRVFFGRDAKDGKIIIQNLGLNSEEVDDGYAQ